MTLSRIGPFALEERIGSQNSSVFRAVHIRQRRSVALKVFAAPLVARNPKAKAALVYEIEALKQLQHENIARCFGGILEEAHGCIAYELVVGQTLAALLERRERLAWETVADYASQLASALEHAHAAGIAHHDLCPGKVMVTENEQIKIVDFRLDRLNNATCVSSNQRNLTRVHYLSPEQLRGARNSGTRADLYALGCLMFEMLVGRPPFTGRTAREVAEQHLKAEAPRVDAIVYDCPVWLDSLIHQLLQKDPDQRVHSSAAVVLALRETRQRVAAKTGVVEHAAGGFSPLQRQVDKDLARKLLSQARRERRERQQRDGVRPPFYEHVWFLTACLLLVTFVSTWLLWPDSEEQLFARAQEVLSQQEGVQLERARPLLAEIVERFPQGLHVDEARMLLDQLDMASAERRLRIRAKLGREPQSEAERLYAEAWNYEQFGDRLTAVEKYRSLVNLLGKDPRERPFINLARRQIEEIERNTSSQERIRFLEDRLADAERLAQEGRLIDARKIWNSIVRLYEGNRELSVHVDRAQTRLDGRSLAGGADNES